jgi:hypothetical protein
MTSIDPIVERNENVVREFIHGGKPAILRW